MVWVTPSESRQLKNISLITSHNFYRSLAGHRWFSGTSNVGANWLRGKKPGLKAWVTSASWGQMNTDFVWQLYMNIYLAEVPGVGGTVIRQLQEYRVMPGVKKYSLTIKPF